MYTNYLIGEGKVLSLFTWDLFYSELFKDNKNRIDHLEGFVTDKKGRHLEDKVKVYLNSDDNGKYFMYNGNKIYVHNYNFLLLDELINTMHREDISFDEFVGTMINNGKDAIIIERLPIKNQKMPNVRSYDYKPEMVEVRCKLVDDKYKECLWYHKMRTIPIDEKEAEIYGTQEFFTSALYSLVKNGYFELENGKNLCKEKSKTLKK